MFIKIFDDVYVNAYHIAQIMVQSSEEFPIQDIPQYQGEDIDEGEIVWYVVLLMSYSNLSLEFKQKHKGEEGEKDQEVKNYNNLQDIIILNETFKHRKEANEFVKGKFGNYLDSSLMIKN